MTKSKKTKVGKEGGGTPWYPSLGETLVCVYGVCVYVCVVCMCVCMHECVWVEDTHVHIQYKLGPTCHQLMHTKITHQTLGRVPQCSGTEL